jgi:hypothetical protein
LILEGKLNIKLAIAIAILRKSYMTSITNILKQATDGLLMMSESEYPFAIFTWESASLNVTTVLEKTGYSQETPVKIVEIDDFFKNSVSEEDWHEDEEKATVKKFQNLVNVLKNNLTGLQVYKIGSKEIDVYILGTTSDGIAGISTKVIET